MIRGSLFPLASAGRSGARGLHVEGTCKMPSYHSDLCELGCGQWHEKKQAGDTVRFRGQRVLSLSRISGADHTQTWLVNWIFQIMVGIGHVQIYLEKKTVHTKSQEMNLDNSNNFVLLTFSCLVRIHPQA